MEARGAVADGPELPRLVLHFDVNETIMLADPAGGDSFEDCCNKIIAKSALVRLAPDGSMQQRWYDGTAMTFSSAPPPPPLNTDWEVPAGCCRYYYKCTDDGKKAAFAQDGEAGAQYRALKDRMVARVAWPAEGLATADPRLCKDGRHVLIPAFFRTISTLAAQGREFTVVIRTFVRPPPRAATAIYHLADSLPAAQGTDIAEVQGALAAFAEGKHPTCAPVAEMASCPLYTGRYDESGTFTLTSAAGETTKDEPSVLAILQGSGAEAQGVRAVGCTDDYPWWSKHGKAASAGKPLWLTEGDKAHHHIFFDDNIKNEPVESIVGCENSRDPRAAAAENNAAKHRSELRCGRPHAGLR